MAHAADPAAELTDFLGRYPDTRFLELLQADMNGILRGKRVGRGEFDSVYRGRIRNCASAVMLDVKGATIPEIPNGSRDGDPDTLARPVPGSLAPVPWLDTPTAQVLLATHHHDGIPFFADPRAVLGRALQALNAMDLHPVIALELEFYLLEPDEDGVTPRPVHGRVPGTTLRQQGLQYAMLEDLWDIEAFLTEVDAVCTAQRIPASTALSEFAPGQLEINLHHVGDPALACDHAVLLKRAIKGVARRHGYGACFMAKPFQEYAGSGLHVHVSLLDGSGRNVFADPAATGALPMSATFRHAIGGTLATMTEGMAIFAPNANSYRRLQPLSFVPLTPNWGYNHRAVAVRIPVSGPEDLRLEHRIAGADANPYLTVAAVLAGIHHGIVERCDPGPMIAEGQIIDDRITLPMRWEAALDEFRNAAVLPRYLGAPYCDIFHACRRSECNRFHAQISNRDYEWYLRAV
ncbi:MAG: glutamine synthetase [Gammaproteobacteria bacterium]|nr:glutamine synthetase [Gammaproteobacteria bacterium]